MLSSTVRVLAVASGVVVVGCGTAASVCGCAEQRCEATFQCEEAAVPEPVCEDPATAPLNEDCGVFVSSSLGNDANPGTRAKPLRTMEQALSVARLGPMRVYACAELFAEAVVVPTGLEIWGGFDCAHDWIYRGGDDRTVIAAGPNRIPLRVEASTFEGLATLADLRLEAASASLPSASAIAMFVAAGARVDLRRSKLIAGDGAAGPNGERGGDEPAKSGAPGHDGAAACTADPVEGASATTTVCGNVTTVGGRGGDGLVTTGESGNDGQPEPIPNPQGLGLGGVGEGNGAVCTAGEGGLPGYDGTQGLGARGPGKITEDGWKGIPGDDGGNGLPGQGGGGGGGSRAGSFYCGIAAGPKAGASGGSGGGGGCGGKGGKGGGYGGASIGLLSFSPDVTVTATSIVTGRGGDGGAGGLAQLGGVGGSPGVGGASFNGSHAGCRGGDGGAGGSGGYGGGGLGGPSLGIAHLIGQPPSLKSVSINTGEPGKGGIGGNQAVPDSEGEDGTRADTLGFPQ